MADNKTVENKKLSERFECANCGERDTTQLFLILPLGTVKYYCLCRYCSALAFKLKDDTTNGK